MSDEQTPEPLQDLPSVEAKPGKKPKADKKKPIDLPQPEESQVAAQADAEASSEIEPPVVESSAAIEPVPAAGGC